MLLATSARADLWTWGYTNGSDLTASGTFTTAGDASSPESITGITGTRNGDAILGVVPLGTDGGFIYDNMFSAASPHFNLSGLLFDVAGPTGHVNLYFDSGDSTWHDWTYSAIPGAVTDHAVRLTVQHVPEPGSFALFGLGVIGLLTSRRKGTKDSLSESLGTA